MATDVKKLSQAHALEILGEEQYNENSEAAQALAEDFTAGWNAALAAQPAPLADAQLADLAAQGTALRTKIAHHSRGGLVELLTHWIGRDHAADVMTEAGDTLEALLDALPSLVDRVRQAEAAATELPKVQEYVSSLLNDLLNHPELPASIQKVLWQHRQQLTVKGGQPNA